MRRFNLSEWAVHQPALVLFLILGFGIAGALAFARLGRAEDPNFTMKVAIVTAIWPGPLHAHRRGRRLRAAQDGGGGAQAAAPQGDERRQGQPLWRAGREDLRRVQPRQARDTGDSASGPL